MLDTFPTTLFMTIITHDSETMLGQYCRRNATNCKDLISK